MPTPRSKSGRLHHHDGTIKPARFYYAAREEAPPCRLQIDPAQHTTWIEADGTVGIRQGTSISIGASATYAANYDTLDWGN